MPKTVPKLVGERGPLREVGEGSTGQERSRTRSMTGKGRRGKVSCGFRI